MTRTSTSSPHPRSAAILSRRISRIPAFTPVPANSRTARARRDGWTPRRQAAFIGHLAETRCVRTAAAKVGMSREGAYRLRRRKGPEGFCAAWDFILGAPGTRAPKVTLERLFQSTRHGSYRPVLRGGQYAGTLHKPDNAALRSALGRLDRATASRPSGGDPGKGHTKQKLRSV